MSDFTPVFAALRLVLAEHAERFAVKANTEVEYTLVTKSPSPFPQHKGHPLEFGSVRAGKAYVSFHLMPLYMCAGLAPEISAALKKRMQGKTCFNFKAVPEAELLNDLRNLTVASLRIWDEKHWL